MLLICIICLQIYKYRYGPQVCCALSVTLSLRHFVVRPHWCEQGIKKRKVHRQGVKCWWQDRNISSHAYSFLPSSCLLQNIFGWSNLDQAAVVVLCMWIYIWSCLLRSLLSWEARDPWTSSSSECGIDTCHASATALPHTTTALMCLFSSACLQ